MKVIPPTDNLKIARQFAEDFIPDTTMKDGFKKMNNFPDSVVKAFKAIRSDRPNQEKYLTLLYLKILRGHLQCCHQTYELRKTSKTMWNTKGIDSVADPLLYEYNFTIKMFDNNRRYEFIASSLAETWLEKNKQLLKYDKIKAEYKIIRTIETNIEKGIYLK